MFRVLALDVDLLLAEILLDPSFFGLALLREPHPLCGSTCFSATTSSRSTGTVRVTCGSHAFLQPHEF